MAPRTLVVSPFNYDLFGEDIDLKKQLMAHASAINRIRRDLLITSIVEIGSELKQAHNLLSAKGCKSEFKQWVECEFSFSLRSAERYMDAFKVLDEQPEEVRMNMSLEAVYALAHVPPSVLEEAVELTQKGKVTLATIGPLLPPEQSPPWRDTWKPRGGGDSNAVKDETMPCPNCGCIYWVPVEGGHDCANCKQPQGEPVGDEGMNYILECVKKIEQYAEDIESMRVALDKQKEIAGDWRTFDAIQLELGKVVVELNRWAEHLRQ